MARRKVHRKYSLLVTVRDQLGPVADRAHEVASVDEVELLSIGPHILHVIDLEADIGGHEAGLNRAEVISKDACGLVLIAYKSAFV